MYRARQLRVSGLVSVLVVVLLLLASVADAAPPDPDRSYATGPAPSTLKAPSSPDRSAVRADKKSKLGSGVAEVARSAKTSKADALETAKSRDLQTSGERVQVYVTARSGQVASATAAVRANGGEVTKTAKGAAFVQAWIPVDALVKVAAEASVVRVSRPSTIILEAGPLATEGLAPSGATEWHTAGAKGAGAKVGIVDGGFQGYGALLGTELPASVTVKNFVDGQNDSQVDGTSKHGTACAEIVYDVAPEAQIYLAKIYSSLDLQEAVTWLSSQGVDVISMSGTFPNEGPGDGTGFVPNLVSTARTNGIAWFNAAGNYRQLHWGGTFSDPDGDDSHNFSVDQELNYFGPGDGNIFAIPAGRDIGIYLRWNDSWTSASQDYDLYLWMWDGATWTEVAASEDAQDGDPGRIPVETIEYTTTAASAGYAIEVYNYAASATQNLEILAIGSARLDEFVESRSIGSPADSQYAVAVGAVDVNAPYTQEAYSSEGPTNGPAGIATGGAIKPDIAAYANVSTASYGTTDKFNGTSAATPHVAGAAALVVGTDPSLTSDQVRAFLTERAVDLGAAGKDNEYGFGRLSLGAPPPPTITSFNPTVGTPGTSVSIAGTHLGGATAVTFSGVAATTFTINSPTQITATVPSGATTGPIAVTTPGGTATSSASFEVTELTCPKGQFKAEIYDGLTDSARLIDAYCEAAGPLAKDWGNGGPSGLTDHYYIRWSGVFDFEVDYGLSGPFRFAAVADDGIIVHVDGVALINQWKNQPPTEYLALHELSAGEHEVVVLYYENEGGAVAKLDWQPSCPVGKFRDEFYLGTTLEDFQASVGCTTAVDYNWSNEGPQVGYGIPADNFSARWLGLFDFPEGSFIFTATADDGVRVWVDDVKVIDAWKDQPPTTYQGAVWLGAGLHTVRMEYYEKAGGAVARLNWEKSCDYPQYRAEYFGNKTLSGDPVLVRCEPAIDYDWGNGAPPGVPVAADNFSVRWTGTFGSGGGAFSNQLYSFTATADDGVRVWVDDVKVIDAWKDQPPTTYQASHPVQTGTHVVRMEYYEAAGGAVARLNRMEGCPIGQVVAEYFSGTTPSPVPVPLRCESTPIDHDWGTGAPASGFGSDNFSARWQGDFLVDTGGAPTRLYTFVGVADDGIRVWVDGQPIIDDWTDHPPRTYQVEVALAQGIHNVTMYYYERTGGAVAKLSWAPKGTRSEVIVDDRSSGFTKGGSYWRESTTGYLAHSWWTYVYGNNVDSWAEWRGNLQGGSYEVLVYVPAANNTTANARYTVYHQGGQTVKAVNQSVNGGKWVSLGTYSFAAGTTRQVRLTDATGEATNSRKIAFDAVRFTPSTSSPETTARILVRGSPSNAVALTFDVGGTDPGATSIVLDTLKANGIKATCFLTGKWTEVNPTLAQRMVSEGHQIANHTYDHPDLTALSQTAIDSQIHRAEAAIFGAAGVYPSRYLRPPYGSYNQTVLGVLGQNSYDLVHWSIDSRDWQGHTADQIVSTVTSNVRGGDVVVFHAYLQATAEALPRICQWLTGHGYQVVTISQMFG